MTEGQKPGKLKKSTGSSVKHILSFALPLMLGTIFQQVYNLVDTMVVGYTLGALSAAFSVFAAQNFGAGKRSRIRGTLGQVLGFLGVCVTEPACWALMAALLGGMYLLKYRATRNEAA